MRSCSVNISYPGAVISCNHYLGRTRGGKSYVKAEAKAWSQELQWLLKGYHIEDWKLPLTVRCSGWFRDARSTPDLANLGKLCLDSIESLTGINDQNYRWQDGTINLCPPGANPYLVIEVKENELS